MKSLGLRKPACALLPAFLVLFALTAGSATAQKVTVVDVIPNFMSNEISDQSEPNLAIDPSNPLKMAASAFFFNPSKPNKGSIFLSTNGGQSWTVQPILPGSVNVCKTSFCDITLRFGGTSGKLYVGALTAKTNSMMQDVMTYQINRFDDVFANPTPVLLEQRTGVIPDCPDQPYVQATTTLGGEGTDLDRLFVGVNDARSSRKPQTATVDVNPNAGAASPAMNLEQEIEAAMPPDPPNRDGSAVRTAFHSSGVVYAAFYSPTSSVKANIVVVKDNKWGASVPPFSDLVNASGVSVVAGTPYSGGGIVTLNKQRVGRSQISIAVDPNDVDSVWLVWGDASMAPITLHVRHSKDGGKTWGDKDLLAIQGATNPALAVNSVGTVGFLYQAVGNFGLWETRIETSKKDDELANPQTIVLSIADSSSVSFGDNNFIGDYDHLMAIGKDFFGVFSALNDPDKSNFPDVDDVVFNREHDLHDLYPDSSHDFPVQASVDPFFFHVESVSQDNDFFVRDWTDAAPNHDPGLEPSSHSVFYKTSDVWNRADNTSGNPASSAAPTHVDPQPGQNFAFVRVGRKALPMAAAPDVDVTPHFYYADFGAGLAYKDLGVAAPLPITFPANQPELTLPNGQGYEWTMPDVHSTHVCMGVELESTDDPFAQPSLQNRVPGWPTLDTAVLYDNNKAQRNIIYPAMKMMSKAHYYALVRNAASVTRNVCLRLDSPVSIMSRYTSIQIDACGIATTSYRPGSTVCLPGMTAGEVRALKVTVDVPQSAAGADLALAFTEVTQPGPAGKPRDGFAISPVATSVDAAAVANLKFQAAVFGRLAALYGDPVAQFWTAQTRNLLASGFTLSQYVAFMQQVRPYLNRLTGLVPRSTSPCAPSPYGDLDRLLGAIQGADPQLIAPAHNDYLQTLDIAITLSQIAVNGPGA